MLRQSCALVMLWVWLAVPALGQTSTVPQLSAGKLGPEEEAPTIDGRVDDEAWMAVEPYSTFIQQDPFEGEPATEKT